MPGGSRQLHLFGLKVCDTSLRQAARWLVERAAARQSARVAFVNAHCVNVAYRDAAYRGALASAHCLLADGSGMAIAARVFGTRLTENVNGTDLFPLLCEEAASLGVPIYLFGGNNDVADRAARRMQRDYPELEIAGTHHGYVNSAEEEARLVAEINASGAQIVLVGLGVPRQDLWIARHRTKLEASVLVGVGGLFDYYSDRIPRAPVLLRATGVEWLWRLAMEPTRLARRYLLGNIEFLARVAWLKIAGLAPEAWQSPAGNEVVATLQPQHR